MNEFTSTNQVDMNLNPTGKGGFGEHPEHRSNGRWRKEDSYTYWLNKFKAMPLLEFQSAREIYDGDQWTVSAEAAYVRIEAALKTLPDFEAVADRTEGKAPQTIIHEGGLFTNNRMEMVVLDAAGSANTEQEAAINIDSTEQPSDS